MIRVSRQPSLRFSLAGTAMLSALLSMSPISDAQTTAKASALQSGTAANAEDLLVLSAVGMRQVLLALAPSFEREIGQRLAVSFDSGTIIGERVQRGETADVIIVPRGVIDELVRTGRVQTASVVDVATSIVGLAVRKGASKPDISSPEALTRTLLAAGSIARPDPGRGGSSGVHIAQILAGLGVAEELRSRTILASNPDREEEMPGAFVASGRAEIALHQVQELMAVPGIEIVGPLPGELRGRFLFSAGIITRSQRQHTGKRLLEAFTRPDTLALIRTKGMETANR